MRIGRDFERKSSQGFSNDNPACLSLGFFRLDYMYGITWRKGTHQQGFLMVQKPETRTTKTDLGSKSWSWQGYQQHLSSAHTMHPPSWIFSIPYRYNMFLDEIYFCLFYKLCIYDEKKNNFRVYYSLHCVMHAYSACKLYARR